MIGPIVEARPPAPPDPGPAPPQIPSRRAARRRSTMRHVAFFSTGMLLAAAAAGVTVNLAADDRPDSDSLEVAAVSVPPPLVTGPPVTTLLIGTHGSPHRGPKVVWMALVASDSLGRKGSIIHIPRTLAAEVPGRGLRTLGNAYLSGGMPLLLVTTENLLEVGIDRYLELSRSNAGVLFEELGPLSVDVPSEVRVAAGANRVRLIFSPGPQRLGAAFLTRLLYVRGFEGEEAALAARHLAFWKALKREFGDDPTSLRAAALDASGALGRSSTSAAVNAELFERIARIDDSEMTLATLPVHEVAPIGGTELYELDAAGAAELLQEAMGIATPPVANRVQILNGNGVPGIGQEVGRRLVGGGFKVVLSGNARRLSYGKTRIISYDPSPEGLEIAERVRDLLGVGHVQISPQTQGIVNLTVVIGKDFLRAN